MARHVARLTDYPDVEKAYMVGILHDIGKVFLGHYCTDLYGQMLTSISNTSYTTYEAEFEFFETTHCEVGLCLAQRWNFPSVYCDVISYHHDSEKATEDTFLTAIVALADFYCLSHGAFGSVAQASIPGNSEDHAWEILRTSTTDPLPSSLEHFLSWLDEEYVVISREADQLFNTMTS
jgi:putative nucleotidyltransferase with HDIG domain